MRPAAYRARLESLLDMEPVFNLVWALVAIAGVGFWFMHRRRKPGTDHSSAIGLALLVVILFPVISVSDDLWLLQNPTETDSFHRRDYSGGAPHFQPTSVSSLPETFGSELILSSWWIGTADLAASPTVDNPALRPVENRPPPAL